MFVEKLNKKQNGVHVIEEEKEIISGEWQGILNHDNVNRETISIHTESKLEGEKIENYFLSTPSETPWKTHLRVFANSPSVFVVYESTGDQVEAEDINNLQDELVNEIDRSTKEEKRIDSKLDKEIDRSVKEDVRIDTKLDSEINRSVTKDNALDKKIDDETTRATNQETIIKADLSSYKISNNKEVNSLKDRATSLEGSKVDKVVGKGLSDENYTLVEKNKLSGVDVGANKYIHPNSHQASMIVESPTKRFVSDTEKANWDKVTNKVDKVTGKSLSDENYTLAEKNKLKSIAPDLNRIEKSNTNGNIKINGAETNVYTHPPGTNPHGTTKADVGLGLVTNEKQATKEEFDIHDVDPDKHITKEEREKLNGVETGATNYIHPSSHPSSMITESPQRRFVSDVEKSNWNSKGDMSKSVYDKNGNGKVDVAENAEKLEGKSASEFTSKEEFDGLEIGGRNHFRPSKTVNWAIASNRLGKSNNWRSFYMKVEEGEVYSLSREGLFNNRFVICLLKEKPSIGLSVPLSIQRDYYYSLKVESIAIPPDVNYIFIYLSNQANIDTFDTIKLEKGNKATDWTPAPEDMVSKNCTWNDLKGV